MTGLRPDASYSAAADAASHLVVMPCPGLGRSLSLFEVGGQTIALYTPPAHATSHGGGGLVRSIERTV